MGSLQTIITARKKLNTAIDYFMRKTPFQKMRYLQLPSIKCQTPPNLKVFKKKRKMEEQGFELLPPNPKSTMLSTIPWPQIYN